MKIYNFLLLIFCIYPNFGKCDENIYIVNTKRPLHVVNDKFLSISVDPAILLTRINLSDISLKMAKHLSPAYVRIAGPSTEFVKYIDSDDKSTEIEADNTDGVIVTPSVWFAVNEWFNMANLTPVFGINDAETTMGVWNPKSILPLFEISDKFNLTCSWQLGYDCSNKTDVQYVEDLKILRHILDAFPDRKKTWKIVGSNVKECTTHQGARRTIDELKGIADYVMWENLENEVNTKKSGDDFFRNFIASGRNNPKIWTVGTKSRRPVTFETALEWAKEVGDASKNGFDVILRQPRLHEFFVDTPVFWFSLLYKTLVGNVILDMKSMGPQSDAEGYAFCAKNQNNFIHRGAMVIMIVNPGTTEYMSQVRLGTLSKNMEVQSYILTTKTDLRTVYLNGDRLHHSLFEEEKITFTPKLRRAKPLNGISFTVPPKSIGFFVLPGAKISVCMNENDELPLLMEEIQEDQNLPLSEELAVDLTSRISRGNSKTLKEMQENLEEELKADKKFYDSDKKGKISGKLEGLLEDMRDEYETQNRPNLQYKIDDETRKMILERAKISEAQKKLSESEQRFIDLGKLLLTKSSGNAEKTKRDSLETLLPNTEKPKTNPFFPLKMHAFPHFVHKPRDHKILNLAHFNHILNHEHLKFLKPTNLHEQLRRISEKSRHNLLWKPEIEKPDVELELSSSEIKKVLADRVKLRAAKTNIRFSNDELDALLKKATDRLKFNHILRQRSKRDINMKLLNEITKREDQKKLKKNLYLMDESEESIPKKETKRTYSSKHIIVNPFTKNSKDNDKDLSSDWSDYDSDFYFEEKDDKKKHKHRPSIKISHSHSDVDEKKSGIPKFKTRSHDDEDVNDFERKYMRLEEYFKNAKQIQEKYDDIDFSGDSDYKDMDSDEKPVRFKRNNEKTTCQCDTPGVCKCGVMNKEEVMKLIDSLLREGNKKENQDKYKELAATINRKSGEKTTCQCNTPSVCNCGTMSKDGVMNLMDSLLKEVNKKENQDKYKELAESINGKLNGKSKRSIDNSIHRYRSVFDNPPKRKPEDILLLGRTLRQSSKYHGAEKINDYYMYKHLLHGNYIKRSIKDNKINDESEETNEIRKEMNIHDLNDKNSTKGTGNGTHPEVQVVIESSKLGLINRIFPKKIDVKTSNIQKVPQEGDESFFHNIVFNFTSFMCKVGNHMKNYFEGLVK